MLPSQIAASSSCLATCQSIALANASLAVSTGAEIVCPSMVAFTENGIMLDDGRAGSLPETAGRIRIKLHTLPRS